MGRLISAMASAAEKVGSSVLVQNEASALMYGMPRVVVKSGRADAMFSDVQLAECLSQAVEVILKERSPMIFPGHRPLNRTG